MSEEKSPFDLTEEQKKRVEPYLQASVKNAFLAGAEYSLCVSENTSNKIDDVLAPAALAQKEQYAELLSKKVRL